MEWIAGLSNADGIRRIYEGGLPTLDRVRIHEISVNREGPAVRIRFDLSRYPASPPVKWQRFGCNTVQVEISFGGVSELSLTRFSVEPICKLSIRNEGSILFSAESESVNLSGVSESALVLNISGYVDGSPEWRE